MPVRFYRSTHYVDKVPKQFSDAALQEFSEHGFVVHMCDPNTGFTFDQLIDNHKEYYEDNPGDTMDSLEQILESLSMMVKYEFINMVDEKEYPDDTREY